MKAGAELTTSALLFCALPAAAQTAVDATLEDPSAYRVVHRWTADDGLPQGSVTCIAQTADGFLWAGTYGGLVRFDGLEFTHFNTVNTPELGSSRVQSLLVSRDGSLWVGTDGGGVTRYREQRFERLTSPDGGPRGAVRAIVEAADGTLWFGARGVSRWRGERIEALAYASSDVVGDILSMAAGAEGEVWAAGHGLFRLDRGRSEPLTPDDPAAPWLTWFVGSTPSLGPFGRCAGGFTRLAEPAPQPDRWLADREIFAILGTTRGLNLVASADGVFLVRPQSDALELTRWFTPPRADASVHALFEDRESSVWLGLDPGGLVQLVPREFRELGQESARLPGGSIAVASDGADGLWISGSESERLWLWRPGRVCEPLDLPGIPGHKELLRGRDGVLWIRSAGALHAARDGALTSFPHPDLGASPTGARLFEDRTGALWCGAPGRLFRLDGAGLRVLGAAEGVTPDAPPLVFAETSDGALWFSDGQRVTRRAAEGSVSWSVAEGLPREQLRALCADSADRVWVGSYGGGLARITAGRVARVNSRHGLYDDFVSRIEDDGLGYLWINSNRGVFRVALADLDAVLDGRAATLTCRALRNAEGNGNGGCRMGAGRLCFPTIDGLVVVDTTRVLALPLEPTVELLEVQVDGRSYPPGEPADVPPGPRDLSFRFAAPTFIDPENTRFAFRLLGLEEPWRESGRERSTRYSNVPPGQYRFEVVSIDSHGRRSPAATSATLTLAPYFHETPWFYGGGIALAVGCLVGAYELRQSRLRRQRAELRSEIERRREAEASLRALAGHLIDAQEEERARIARDLHDDLNQSLALLAIELEVLAGTPPVERAQGVPLELRRLSGRVQDISSDVHRMAYQLHPVKLSQLGLAPALRGLCESTTTPEFRVEWSEVGPPPKLPPQPTACLFRVAQEALQNAAQHSGAAGARVELETRPGRVRLTISDQGAGFDVGAARGARGLGLISMRERVGLAGGRFEIRSAPGAGTRVEAELPFSEATGEARGA